jgi:hypothetical protein
MQIFQAVQTLIYNKKLIDPSKMHMVKPRAALASRTELAALAALVVVDDPAAPLVCEPPDPGVPPCWLLPEDVPFVMPSPPVVVVDFTTAGQVRLNNGVVDNCDVIANLASLSGLESLRLYHHTLVLPNN